MKNIIRKDDMINISHHIGELEGYYYTSFRDGQDVWQKFEIIKFDILILEIVFLKVIIYYRKTQIFLWLVFRNRFVCEIDQF